VSPCGGFSFSPQLCLTSHSFQTTLVLPIFGQGLGGSRPTLRAREVLAKPKIENLAQLRAWSFRGDHMVNLLDVEVWESGITVTLPGTSYWATYIKQNDSSGLFARVIADKDDPRVGMTLLEFLDKAWKLANERATELGWLI
jgi:hypothetical protein